MDLFRLDGKTALVTGGTRGIGLMIARGLLEAGAARVVISSRKAAAVDEAVAELSKVGGGEVVGVPADLSTEEECLRLAGTVEGPLHILVNNAGATWGAPLEEFPSSAWDKVIDLNLKSPFYLTKALVPRLREAATADDPARIINIGSIDGIMTPGQRYSYTSSKAAVHQLTRVLAKELGPQAITVNAIAPGPFESKMMAATLDAFGEAIAEAVPLKRIGRPDDMAGAAVFLASRAGSYVNGAVIPVDGGLTVA
ncbi:SDR family oxidoreductase [Actinocorallia populi]|uniref:SDR family oxidoreductase n=1 Tax=Actinocorallia populi TaxID=2079200 RepID=UPI000D0887D8|nr:SDR family oxidoreductase [Actinocorallia populi]